MSHDYLNVMLSVVMLREWEVPLSGGYAAWCAGTIQGKEGGIQVLAGRAPSSQTVGLQY